MTRLVYLVLGVVIVGVSVGALILPLFMVSAFTWGGLDIASMASRLGVQLQSVTVSGRQRTLASDLLSVLDVAHGQSLLSIDVPTIKSRVESLAWVRSATVHRYFPDRLHVRLVERTPVALWQDDDAFKLVDADGHLIDAPLFSSADLFLVVGPGAPGAASDLLVTLSTQPRIMKRITAATRVGLRRWDLWLGKIGDEGIRIKLPETGMRHALDVLSALDQRYNLLGRPIEIMDMRFSGRLILKLAAKKNEDSRSSSGKWLRKVPLEVSPDKLGDHSA